MSETVKDVKEHARKVLANLFNYNPLMTAMPEMYDIDVNTVATALLEAQRTGIEQAIGALRADPASPAMPGNKHG